MSELNLDQQHATHESNAAKWAESGNKAPDNYIGLDLSDAQPKQEPIKKTLVELFIERLELMDELLESGGDVTDNDELASLWQNNEMALADKIDNYGRVVKGLEAKRDVLKAEIDSVKESLSKKISAVDNHINRIKERMFTYCPLDEDGKPQPLRGNIYSFLPRISVKKTVPDIEKVEEKFRTITLDVRGQDLLDTLKSLKTTRKKFEKMLNPVSVKERALLADLPSKKKGDEEILHPAISVSETKTTQLR